MPNKHVSIFNLSYEIHELMKPKKTLYQQEGGVNFAGYDPNLLLGGGYGAGDFGVPTPSEPVVTPPAPAIQPGAEYLSDEERYNFLKGQNYDTLGQEAKDWLD